ncbi:hypothetical protein MHU86_4596 [Fragilaria crotonensis]|nr:hypothetical protein MHU86_4596 [Fragilaria crotonensis]
MRAVENSRRAEAFGGDMPLMVTMADSFLEQPLFDIDVADPFLNANETATDQDGLQTQTTANASNAPTDANVTTNNQSSGVRADVHVHDVGGNGIDADSNQHGSESHKQRTILFG